MNPGNIVWQDRSIAIVPERNREGKNFEKTGGVSRRGTAEAPHHAITRGGDVAFRFIDFANCVRQF